MGFPPLIIDAPSDIILTFSDTATSSDHIHLTSTSLIILTFGDTATGHDVATPTSVGNTVLTFADSATAADIADVFSAGSIVLTFADSATSTDRVTDTPTVVSITRTFSDMARGVDVYTLIAAPYITLATPGNASVDNPPDTGISLDFHQGAGDGTNLDGATITINGVPAWSANAPLTGWGGNFVTFAGFRRISIFPLGGFAFGEVVSVLAAVPYNEGTATGTFSFTIEAESLCWSGVGPTSFELRMAKAFSIYALEQLRVRLFHASTTTHDTVKSVRAVFQMAYETEIGAAITKLVRIPPEVVASLVCERRRYLEIDADMKKYYFLIDPAFAAVNSIQMVPTEYLTLLKSHVTSAYARYRVCALSAFVCMSTAYLTKAP